MTKWVDDRCWHVRHVVRGFLSSERRSGRFGVQFQHLVMYGVIGIRLYETRSEVLLKRYVDKLTPCRLVNFSFPQGSWHTQADYGCGLCLEKLHSKRIGTSSFTQIKRAFGREQDALDEDGRLRPTFLSLSPLQEAKQPASTSHLFTKMNNQNRMNT